MYLDMFALFKKESSLSFFLLSYNALYSDVEI